MRGKIQWIVSLFLLMTLCSCGIGLSGEENIHVQEAEQEQEADPMEKAVFKNSESTVKEKRFENDYIRIWQRDDYIKEIDSEAMWIRENLDGTGRKAIEIENLIDLLWLTNDWLYYITSTDGYEKGYVCRAPLTEGQEFSYDAKQSEVLWEIEDFGTGFDYHANFFVTDYYIFYGLYQDNAVVFYRYDIESGKSFKTFWIEHDIGVIILDSVTNLPVILDDTFFIGDEDGIYRVSFRTLQPQPIYSGEYFSSDITPMVECGGSVYFCTEVGVDEKTLTNELLRFDGERGEVSTILDKQALIKMLDEMQLRDEGAKEQEEFIDQLYTYQEKLYMLVTLNWVSPPVKILEGPLKGEKESMFCNREVLLSADLSDLTHWELVQPLEDYILENAAPNAYVTSGKQQVYKADVKSTVDTISDIETMDEGIVYFYMQTKEDGKEVWNAYHIDTGEIRQIDREDSWHWYHWAL